MADSLAGTVRAPRALVIAGMLATAAGMAVAAPAQADDAITTDSTLGQVTGLAADPGRKVYWVPARTAGKVQAVGADGKVKATVSFGATPQDAQAISFHDSRVWVGDVGDQAASRPSVTAYRFGDLTDGTKAPYRSFTLAYPDGAKDCGAMAVSRTGKIYLVTRGSKPGIYRTAGQPVPGGPTNTLVRVADAPANVTDATFGADGSSLVLRTLTSVHVLDAYKLTATATAALPETAQGLGVATALGGDGLVLSNLSSPATFTGVVTPTTLASVPPAPASPAPASPSAAPSAAAAKGTSAVAQNRGTLWALVVAGLISLASGAFVALKH